MKKLDMSEHLNIRAVIFQDGDTWVAQGVDYDIGADAPDVQTLHARFEAVVMAEAQESIQRYGSPFKGIPAAPSEYADLWASKNLRLGAIDGHLLKSNSDELELDIRLCA